MIYVILAVGAALMVLERLFPDQRLPHSQGWWVRVALLNLRELGIVILGGYTWQKWFHNVHIFNLGQQFSPFTGAIIAYLLLTFIYYWWHRARHDINFLWLTLHQVHHSPQRIETITSFYKHPIEILINAIIIGGFSYVVLGLTIEGAALVDLLTALAEYFYHMNIRTPQWIGYILQRPENHRIHHQRGRHYDNFADLPLWDILFGTFQNPPTYQGECGFTPEREARLKDMLLFKNVNNAFPKEQNRR